MLVGEISSSSFPPAHRSRCYVANPQWLSIAANMLPAPEHSVGRWSTRLPEIASWVRHNKPQNPSIPPVRVEVARSGEQRQFKPRLPWDHLRRSGWTCVQSQVSGLSACFVRREHTWEASITENSSSASYMLGIAKLLLLYSCVRR